MTNFADQLLNAAFIGLVMTDENNTEMVAALLDKYGLRWNVSKQKLLLPNGTDSGFMGIVREDTSKVFATCKDSYVPYQNSELAELLIRIADKTGYEIHSGGSFNGGAKVYLQLNTGNQIDNLGENRTTVKGYATGLNSHDGSKALGWGATNITVCCLNTFAMAFAQMQQRARHSKGIHDKVEASIRQITGIAEAEKTIFDKFIKLAEIPVKQANIAKIVRNITEVDILKPRSEQPDLSTYSINRSEELLGSIAKEMKQKGETLWGLFSGVTHYTSHVLPVPKRENARLESKYTGTGLDVDNSSFAQIVEMANLN